MSEEIQVKSELEQLKERATQLGLKFGPNIGVDLLRARVNAVINGDAELDEVNDEDEEFVEEEETVAKTSPNKPKLDKKLAERFGETEEEKRVRLRKDAFKLIRVRIQCMNPLKKAMQGEVFTVSNSVVGTYRKFVPYNVESDEGWLVPKIMLNMIKERKFNQIRYEKKNGLQIPKAHLVKEFAIEILPQLTKEELKELAQRQALSRSVE